jgi:translocation and assembly module TamB
MRRLALGLALALAPVAALVVALVAAAVATPVAAQGDDRGMFTRFLEDNLSGAGRTVRIEGFEGALSSVARIGLLTIADDAGVWLSLRGVELDWNRLALFRGRLEVNRLVAAEIDVARAPVTEAGRDLPSPEATPFALPELPVSVRIGRIATPRLTLGPTLLGEPVAIRLEGTATLAGGEGSAEFLAERIDGPAARLRLAGSYANATRFLDLTLEASEPAGGIAARLAGIPGTPALDLSVSGRGPIDAWDGRIRLASDGAERLAGTVSLRSDGETSGFAVDVAGDLAPLFLPDYRAFFGDRIALAAEGRRSATGALTLDPLRLESAQVKLSGSARLAPDGLPEVLRLDLVIASGDGAPVLLPLPGDPVRVQGARVALIFDPAAADEGWRISGRLEGLDAPAVAIAALDLAGSGRIARQPGGSQAVGGTIRFGAAGLAPRDPGLAEALGAAVEGFARFNWLAGGALRITDLAVTGEGYGATGALALSAADRPAIEGRIAAEFADFARLSRLADRPLGGSGQVSVEGRVVPLDGAFDARLAVTGRDLGTGIAELDGLLAGEASVTLDAARDATGTTVRALALRAGTLAVDAAGTIRTQATDFTATARFDDLRELGPDWRGALAAELRIRQADGADRLRLTGTATDLGTGIAELDGFLRGTTRLYADATHRGGTVVLDAFRIDGPSIAATAAGTVTPGDPLAGDVAATVTLPDLARLGPLWGGAIRAEVRATAGGGREALRLTATTTDLRTGQAEADRLLSGPATLALDARREAGVIRLDRFRLDGRQVTAEATGRRAGDATRVDLSARLSDLSLLVPGVPGALTLAGRIDADPSGYALDLALRGPGGIDATAAGRIAPDGGRATLRAAGRAEAALANAFVAPASVRGAVTFDLTLDGRPTLAALGGRVALAGGRVAMAGSPLALADVTATVALAGGRAQIEARARSESGGTLALSGPVGLTAPHAGSLALELADFVLRDPTLYQTSLSGRVTVDGPLAGGARIAGGIVLGTTEVQIPSSGLGGASSIPDLRHLREPPPVRLTRARAGLLDDPAARGSRTTARPYPLDLRVDAPNRVFIRGRGLDAELGGRLVLSGTSAAPIPIGGFDLIRGRLDLLGKRFDLTRGKLFVEGDFIPRLDLVATAESDAITASISVEGRADEPAIRFRSSPELPEEEVVARLLFGRGLEKLSAFQAAQLAAAVATLTGRGGAGIVERLRRGFGLDNFDVQTGADGAAAFRAGKYLAENVYADVIFGAKGRTEVTLNLDVSRSVTVRGRAANDGTTGIGIYFERDY